MIKKIHDAGRQYSSIFMGNIGLFIFAGLLFVIFQDGGWFPNENLYGIARLVYSIVIPVCISYTGGAGISGQTGGILSVLTLSGMLYADTSTAILAAMISAPAGGILWKKTENRIKKYAGSSMQMLIRNLLTGVIGGILAGAGYYLLSPVLDFAGQCIAAGIEFLFVHKLYALCCVFIEPAKVFFLNNVVNHGILVPIGMEQLQETGSSVLFLLETNPGPGFGVLTALFLSDRRERQNYAAALAAEFAGGIHEVYFPAVLENLRLLLPLIVSGAAGAWWFNLTGAGTCAPVSPGSVFTILIMAGKGKILITAAGILISAAVSFLLSLLILKMSGPSKEAEKENDVSAEKISIKEQNPLRYIGFVCDAGVGSSAMGAALFRRTLARNGITDVQVEAYACDQIPDFVELVVCQKDFQKMLPEKVCNREIVPVDSLLSQQAFEKLAVFIQERNRR